MEREKERNIHMLKYVVTYIVHCICLPVDQQIVPMDRSVAILEALCSQVSAALGRPTPLDSDDLHYCKLIWKADTILLKKVSLTHLKLLTVIYGSFHVKSTRNLGSPLGF